MNCIKTPSTDTSIGILGLGSIGCLIASQLPASNKVYALSRTSSKYINFTIRDEIAERQYQVPNWKGEILDILIICCKASQTLEALHQWQAAITIDTQIILLQNGYGQHEKVTELFPNNSLFAASTTEGANRIDTSTIKHAGLGITQWGYFSGPETKLKLELTALSGKHKYNKYIHQVLIEKLAINCVINPLTVKFNCPNGELISNPIAYKEFQRLCLEIDHFFAQINWRLSFNLFDRAEQVALLTANNVSSMLQDYRNQRQSEIDCINGYLVNKAKDNNISIPINEVLVKEVKALGLL